MTTPSQSPASIFLTYSNLLQRLYLGLENLCKELAMKLRGYLGTSFMIAAIMWLPFLFIMMVLYLYSYSLDIGEAFRNSFLTSIVVAAMYGAILGFLYRIHHVTVLMPDVPERLEKLMLETAKLGYHTTNKSADIITFAPNIYGGKLAGNISVLLTSEKLVLTGPWYHTDTLARNLKAQ